MKKIIKLLLVTMFTVSLVGCSSDNERSNTVDTTEQINQNSNDTQITADKILVVYFSVPEMDGVDTSSSASRVATEDGVVGNTQYVANIISQEMGDDLYRIETVQTYPETHDSLLEFAYEERSEDARPELKNEIDNFDEYDTVFIGYPNWNADLPMPLYTFLEQYDFTDKTIIPFTTHGGSGFSGTIGVIADLQPNATVISNGLSISRNDVASCDNEIKEWLDELQIK
ncbi:flavodoxin [Thomasclavelia saccharogumia]|uniref:flavodoxin n=1 Tax=Thomasclavelia saccharogumia TaxID=341225 RepID=UPI00054FAD58|nr:flavodoxin [Thomasclavelia saccharogumia]